MIEKFAPGIIFPAHLFGATRYVEPMELPMHGAISGAHGPQIPRITS